MRIAIYGSRHQDEFVEAITGLLTHLVSRGDTIVAHEKIFNYLYERVPGLFDELGSHILYTPTFKFEADLALSIGGDGTFLRTAQWVGEKEIPIVGVNTGHLGFLAPFTIDEARQAIDDDCLTNYKIISRSMLRVDVPGTRVDTWPYALNEVALLKKDTASMISVDASIDGAPLAEYLCDGLLVSTPTGSTGYNLSVGGPIVQPGSPSIVISPIAAHSLTMRPLVIDDGAWLEMSVNTRAGNYRVSLDGRSVNLPCGAVVNIRRADFVIRSVMKPGHNFFATLREKLLWGASANANKLSR